MKIARNRRVLLIALALSLALHLVLAGYWYWPRARQQPLEQISNVRITRIVRRTPPPPQTPAPTPLQSSVPAAQKQRPRVTPPRLTSRNGRNTVGVRETVQPPRVVVTATPPRAGCIRPNAPSAISATPEASEITADARTSRVSGTAAVDVSLDASGRVLDAKIARSSGNGGLDATALSMARGADYSPQFVACKTVASTYTFTVKFVAW